MTNSVDIERLPGWYGKFDSEHLRRKYIIRNRTLILCRYRKALICRVERLLYDNRLHIERCAISSKGRLVIFTKISDPSGRIGAAACQIYWNAKDHSG